MTDKQAEVYIDAKQGAQILNNVSVRTFYRYLDKASEELSVQTTTQIVNDHAVKLYRKADIVRLAVALNKDRTVLSYVTQNVRQSVNGNGNHATLIEATADKAVDLPAIQEQQPFSLTPKFIFKINFSTLLTQVLTTALILFFVYKWLQVDISENRAFRSEYRDSRLIQKIEDEEKIFFGQ